MSEKDLNIKYICEKTLLSKDDELVPIILELIQESYKSGLSQAEYNNTMNLIEENQKLIHIIEELEKWLREQHEKVWDKVAEEMLIDTLFKLKQLQEEGK